MPSTTVFVSGATGYIALHIVQDLLAKGYTVIGSVRSTEKGEKIKKQLNNERFSFEVVKDLAASGAFDEALKKHPETEVFLHTASPANFDDPDIEKDMIIPAVEGTKNALKAIKAYGPNVKKVVVTSSYVLPLEEGIYHIKRCGKPSFDDLSKENDPNHTIDESSWNNITWEQGLENPLKGYFASKVFAERAAWDFVKEEKPQFTLATLNPVYVFGPQAFDEDAKGTLNYSAEIINGLLKLDKYSEVPSTNGHFIDVRDVSKAHIAAFENPAAEGQRLLLFASRFTSQGVLNVLHANFPQLSAKLPVGGPDLQVEYVQTNNDKTRKILGFQFIDLEKSVVDTVQQILDANEKQAI